MSDVIRPNGTYNHVNMEYPVRTLPVIDEYERARLLALLRGNSKDEAGCRVWTGKLDRDGYGLVKTHKKAFKAHRLWWLVTHGSIPAGQFVLHKCPNGTRRDCIRGTHLFLGTKKDNTAYAIKEGRLLAGERTPQAILTDQEVRMVLARYRAGEKQAMIAHSYKIDVSVVWNIIHGFSWSDVTGIRHPSRQLLTGSVYKS